MVYSKCLHNFLSILSKFHLVKAKTKIAKSDCLAQFKSSSVWLVESKSNSVWHLRSFCFWSQLSFSQFGFVLHPKSFCIYSHPKILVVPKTDVLARLSKMLESTQYGFLDFCNLKTRGSALNSQLMFVFPKSVITNNYEILCRFTPR